MNTTGTTNNLQNTEKEVTIPGSPYFSPEAPP